MNNKYINFIVLLAAIFLPLVPKEIPFINFFDELLCLFSASIIIKNYKALNRAENKLLKKMLLTICIITVLGLYCNHNSKIQTALFPIFTDIFSCFKIFIIYIGITLKTTKISFLQFSQTLKIWSKFLKILIIIMFIGSLLNFGGDFGMRGQATEIRFGLPVFCFLYEGGGVFSSIFYTIISILTIELATSSKSSKLYIILSLFVWMTSLRSRAILFIITYLLLSYYIFKKKKVLQINIKTVSIGLILFYLVCADQAEYYMGNENMPRFNLAFYGFVTMMTYFPFGSGFATYGTDSAAKYYSPLYYDYGFENIWGLAPDAYSMASDNYWPAIIGQFGIVGLFLFSYLLYLLFRDIIHRSNNNKYLYLIAIFTCFSQIIASMATSTFFSPTICYLMFTIAFLLKLNTIKS